MAAAFTTSEKIARARQVLLYFHNRAVSRWSNHYHFNSVDELVNSIESFAPGFSRLYGQAIGYATDLSESEIEDALTGLCDAVQGVPPGKPTDLTAFYDALSNKLANWDFSKWGSVIAEASAEAASSVGKLALGGVALWAMGFLAVLYVTRR